MRLFAASFFMVLVFFVAIDFVWLTRIARSLYAAEMGSLLRKQPNIIAAALFYLLYAAGLTFFAVLPGLKSASIFYGAILGGALGLVAYGAYDLTNLAVLEGYSLKLALIDLAWGTALSGATCATVTGLLLVTVAR